MNEQITAIISAVVNFLVSTDVFKDAIKAEVTHANASQIIANKIGQRVTVLEEQVQGRTREASPDDLEDRLDDVERRLEDRLDDVERRLEDLNQWDFDAMQSEIEESVRDLHDCGDTIEDIVFGSHLFEDAVREAVGELDTADVVERLERLESKLSDIGSILS